MCAITDPNAIEAWNKAKAALALAKSTTGPHGEINDPVAAAAVKHAFAVLDTVAKKHK